MSLKLSEIFDSIQGEGPWNGVPSTFIRLSGCPLRCRWCDTPYASHHPEGETLSLEELVRNAATHAPLHVVITGGEPFAFEELPALVEALQRIGRVVTIETSGVIFRSTTADKIVLSPKLNNSDPRSEDPFSESERGRHVALRTDDTALRQFAARPEQLALKFVAEQRTDVEEAAAIVRLFPTLPPEQIFLMPQARDPERLAELSRRCAEWCLERGWRLGTRLQVQLWGDRRGV